MLFFFFALCFFSSVCYCCRYRRTHPRQSLGFFSLIFSIFLLVVTVDKQQEARTHQSFHPSIMSTFTVDQNLYFNICSTFFSHLHNPDSIDYTDFAQNCKCTKTPCNCFLFSVFILFFHIMFLLECLKEIRGMNFVSLCLFELCLL